MPAQGWSACKVYDIHDPTSDVEFASFVIPKEDIVIPNASTPQPLSVIHTELLKDDPGVFGSNFAANESIEAKVEANASVEVNASVEDSVKSESIEAKYDTNEALNRTADTVILETEESEQQQPSPPSPSGTTNSQTLLEGLREFKHQYQEHVIEKCSAATRDYYNRAEGYSPEYNSKQAIIEVRVNCYKALARIFPKHPWQLPTKLFRDIVSMIYLGSKNKDFLSKPPNISDPTKPVPMEIGAVAKYWRSEFHVYLRNHGTLPDLVKGRKRRAIGVDADKLNTAKKSQNKTDPTFITHVLTRELTETWKNKLGAEFFEALQPIQMQAKWMMNLADLPRIDGFNQKMDKFVLAQVECNLGDRFYIQNLNQVMYGTAAGCRNSTPLHVFSLRYFSKCVKGCTAGGILRYAIN